MESEVRTYRTGGDEAVRDLAADFVAALGDLLPADDRRHRHGSSGHGRSHVMPAIVPPQCTVPVIDGRLALGTWQSICLVDLNVDKRPARGGPGRGGPAGTSQRRGAVTRR